MRGHRAPPHDGDQLRLDLFKGVPWDGRSPRGLTGEGKGLYLRPEPYLHEVRTMDPEQLELWPVEVPTLKEKPPRFVYEGAPLL